MFEVFMHVVILDDLFFNFMLEVLSFVSVLTIIYWRTTLVVRIVFMSAVITLKVNASPALRSKPTKYPGFSFDSGKDVVGSW